MKIRATGFTGRSSAQSKPANCHFLSWGERIKGEGERKTQIQFAPVVHPKMISEIRSQDVRLTKAVDVRHYYIMSDTNTLGKRRTVRFEARIDGLISARAEAEKKSISRVIRDSVIAGLQTGGMTAGDWILSVADNKARSASAERLAFRKKYRERHQ